MRTLIFVFLSFLLPLLSTAQNSILAGPYTTGVQPNEATIWLATPIASDTPTVAVKDPLTNRINYADKIKKYTVNKEAIWHFSFQGLSADTDYKTIVLQRKKERTLAIEGHFRTASDSLRPLRFAFGSCNFIGKHVVKLTMTAPHTTIHNAMLRENPDFMLWLGDNVYYWGRDFKSKERMVKRHMYYRKHKRLNRFMKSTAHYAIWDDHDFGPNNAHGDFPYRDSALSVHKLMWPGPDYGHEEGGIFHSFKRADIEFFMLDNRYFSKIDGEQSQALGKAQMQWLKNELKQSTATFKFICSGIQWLNTVGDHSEGMHQYTSEKEELLQFIADEKIRGVVFLTGDRHLSSIEELEIAPGHKVYDITSSPILSPLNRRNYKQEHKTNPNILPNSMFIKRTFTTVDVKGRKGERKLYIRFLDKHGEEITNLILNEGF